jgi:prepilin-type N-terminal cleavage/methylation domain-containing protein
MTKTHGSDRLEGGRGLLALPFRRGYTITEMIVGLAVLGTLLALAVPAVLKPLAREELHDAAKQVQQSLAQARQEAIETGQAHEFRFEPGGRRFEVAPRDTAPTPSSRGLGGMELASADFADRGAHARDWDRAMAVQPEPVQDELPAGATFSKIAEGPVGDEAEKPNAAAEAEHAAGDWSPPIVFYPNGRASNARIRLMGQGDEHVDIVLRGLTGDAQVGTPVEAEAPNEPQE